ncbi:hypothetical protein AB0903_31615 [Streptomyces sp. NPDC048389]|uniref:hypothetical protein n=1 Tax=Streptomyces sp. NPDC048389 TaxID=3154622 RepID=UPI003451C053
MSGVRICVRCDRPIAGQAVTVPQLFATSGARPDDYQHRDGDAECRPRTLSDR